MFQDFFHLLRDKYKVGVTLPEWMTLQEAVAKGLAQSSLSSFYHVARAVLIKRETDFDKFDLAFAEHFRGVQTPEDVLQMILAGMDKVPPLELSEAEMAAFDPLELEEVRQRFEKQLAEGHFNHHVGGNQAIGTGGRSTQGAFGYHPTGVRIGQGESRHRRAIQIAERRQFRNYNPNLVLDTRTMKVALARLRKWVPVGPRDQVDVEGTIDSTAKNAGDIDIEWMREKRAGTDIVLAMDVGGSMSLHSGLVSRLFSAARSLFHNLQYYYFHNCFYQDVYTDIELLASQPTPELWKKHGPETKLILVGDASMGMSELLNVNGAIDYYYHNDEPGLDWLRRVRSHFDKVVWLNPEPADRWKYTPSIAMIAGIFPMYELTLNGLDEAIPSLMK